MSQRVTTIEVDDNYRIEVDDLNYGLVRRTVREKDGETKETWTKVGYYSSCDAVLWRVVELEAASQGLVEGIEAFLKMYREIAEKYRRRSVIERVDRQLDKLRASREEREEAARAKQRERDKRAAEKRQREPKPKPKPKPKRKPARKPAKR